MNEGAVDQLSGRERNATRAAERLNMSPPAVSRALDRLRAALGDELFVRTPEGMAWAMTFSSNIGGPSC
jgi:DNA-binding transcriptional LysR family regulator